MRTLLLLAMLVSFLPSQNLGKPIGSTPTDNGTCTLYERGMVYTDGNGWTLSYATNGEPMVLRASWESDTAAGRITVEVEYEIPSANPTPAQMRKYGERFKLMVAVQQDLFPPIPVNGGDGGGNAGGAGVWVLPQRTL